MLSNGRHDTGNTPNNCKNHTACCVGKFGHVRLEDIMHGALACVPLVLTRLRGEFGQYKSFHVFIWNDGFSRVALDTLEDIFDSPQDISLNNGLLVSKEGVGLRRKYLKLVDCLRCTTVKVLVYFLVQGLRSCSLSTPCLSNTACATGKNPAPVNTPRRGGRASPAWRASPAGSECRAGVGSGSLMVSVKREVGTLVRTK
jgi:hypothetical protein